MLNKILPKTSTTPIPLNIKSLNDTSSTTYKVLEEVSCHYSSSMLTYNLQTARYLVSIVLTIVH